MGKTIFLIKKKYNKILKSLMSAEDKIDYTLDQISSSILKLADARTSILKLKNDKFKPQLETIEKKIRELQDKHSDLLAKKSEYLAKIKALEVERDLLKTMNSLYGETIETNFSDIEDEIKNLEAEIDTLNFLSKGL
jgi:chromosome segregation ATPase